MWTIKSYYLILFPLHTNYINETLRDPWVGIFNLFKVRQAENSRLVYQLLTNARTCLQPQFWTMASSPLLRSFKFKIRKNFWFFKTWKLFKCMFFNKTKDESIFILENFPASWMKPFAIHCYTEKVWNCFCKNHCITLPRALLKHF